MRLRSDMRFFCSPVLPLTRCEDKDVMTRVPAAIINSELTLKMKS